MVVTPLDPAFNVIPQNSTAFIIWRVENMKLVELPKDQYGKFYKGDSYLIYAASEYGRPAGISDVPHIPRGSLDIHIHFWLGSESSQDETGVAAIKSVELDDTLGGDPIQHRETEGNESKRFLSYFKSGIRLLTGGIASGFHKVDLDAFQVALYHIKGKRSTVIKEMPTIEWKAMNDGDCYILDTKDFIFVWIGRNSNNMEKIQAAKFAVLLRSEHGNHSDRVVVVEDGQEHSMSKEEKVAFQRHLDLSKKQVLPQDQVQPDDAVARRQSETIKLLRCSDTSGSVQITEVKGGPLMQADLDCNDSFIIDNGIDGIWVWVGKKATTAERKAAMNNALNFVKKKGYPQRTRVSRVIDGAEPSEFKVLFCDWRSKYQSKGLPCKNINSNIAQVKQTKFDAKNLHKQTKMQQNSIVFDDGSGDKQVWRVKKFDLVPVNENEHGEFFMGDCYIVLYTYYQRGAKKHLLFYWIGVDATIDEATTVAAKCVEMDNTKLHGVADQVRVDQGKEPPQFMAAFGGKIVLYKGGFASAFKNSREKDEERKNSYMLQIRGTTDMNIKAIEVDLRAGCLNSNDCFVIVYERSVRVWCGEGSSSHEQQVSKAIAQDRGEYMLMHEGNESSEFWLFIGGKEAYADNKTLKDEATHSARLFHCSDASGVFKVEEVVNFSQEDLVDDDVMLLDIWDTLFIWVGCNSNKHEYEASEQLAFEYLDTDPAGRTGVPIIKIKQGYEPLNFTGFFGAWDNDLWNNNMTYADISARLKEVAPGSTVLLKPSSEETTTTTYSLDILKTSRPQGVDPSKKEIYLSDKDFASTFGMTREKFKSLPSWKKINLKKKVGLF